MTRQTIAREASRAISEKSVLPITLGLLGLICAGVWALASEVSEFNSRLSRLEGDRWTYAMAREAWAELSRKNPTIQPPNISEIRADFGN